MISVVIPTLDCERQLVRTLAALVTGAAAGLVREVVIADGGSRDDTEAVADAAGCVFISAGADLGARLRAGAEAATRGEWLLFLHPAAMLEEGWTREVRKFVDLATSMKEQNPPAATFRLCSEGFGVRHRLRDRLAGAQLMLTGRPRLENGLLITKHRYRALGGYADGVNAHRRLVARLGRNQIVKLRSRVIFAADD